MFRKKRGKDNKGAGRKNNSRNSLNRVERLERKQLEELENLEREIKKTKIHPLRKITLKDISKGFVGALIGTSAHLVFLESVEVAERISNTQATSLYVFSYLVGAIFLYMAGYRKVRQVKLFNILPLRVTTMFIVSIIVILIISGLFGLIHGTELLYRQVAVIMLPAMIGACAADLIGND
jgi:uncharacterized membrane protein